MFELLIIALIKLSLVVNPTVLPGSTNGTPNNPNPANTETPPPTSAESGGNTWGEGGVR